MNRPEYPAVRMRLDPVSLKVIESFQAADPSITATALVRTLLKLTNADPELRSRTHALLRRP
jgi:hypothetical protein